MESTLLRGALLQTSQVSQFGHETHDLEGNLTVSR